MTLQKESSFFHEQKETEYQAMIPKLPVPASKQESVAAMNLFIERERKFHDRWHSRRLKLGQKLERHLNELQGSTQLEHMWPETQRLILALEESDKAVDRANRLQLTVQGLMDGQTETLKRWYLTECLQFGSHLDKQEKEPESESRTEPSEPRPPKRAPTPEIKSGLMSDPQLPPEIASAVYSFCDVESCVALRQASSFWYTAFQGSDHVLQNVLAARNPWFQLEGDLVTWGQCLLVFEARLRSWRVVEDSNEMATLVSKARRPQLEDHFLTATPLKFGERAPVGFSSLATCHPLCRSYNCGKVHLSHGGENRVLDVVDGSVENSGRVVLERGTEQMTSVTVLKVGGFEITLPGTAEPLFRRPWESCILFFNHHILVRTRTNTFLFQRNKPLHYKHAITVPTTYAIVEPAKELGSFYFAENRLLDPNSGELFTLPPSLTASLQPTAIYKGVIWCRESATYQSERLFTPTFVDLKTPSKIYCLPSKSLLTYDPWRMLTQMTTFQNTHLVTAMEPRGLTVVDLDTRKVTTVVKPDYEIVNKRSRAGRERLQSGFVNNKFQVWYVDLETVKRYTMDVWGLDETEVDEDDLVT